MDIETVQKMGVSGEGGFTALVGKRHDKGQRGIGECLRRRPCRSARHISDAVVIDAIDDIGGAFVSRWPTGFEAASLVYRDIHEYTAGPHQT